MMEWVCCNKCSLKFQPNVKFNLSECGHIFCEKCIVKLKQTKKCIVCDKTTSVMELSKDMDYTTQMFFWPIENILQQCLQVSHFQAMHRNMFLQSLTRKYSYAKKECMKLYAVNKKLQKENQLMSEMLKAAGYKPPNIFATSTPAAHSIPSCDNNISMLSSIRLTPSSQMNYPHQRQGTSSINFSTLGPSPAQMVPKGYTVPVHGKMMPSPASYTPNFMAKGRGQSGYRPSFGYPRK